MENLLSVCRDLEILLSAFQIEAAKAINWHSCHLAYSLSHISSPTHTSGRRWGLTNRPFISCQSSFIGFKWSLITTVLQSPIMVFFPPYGVWWEGEVAQCVCMCVLYSHCFYAPLCISPYWPLTILIKTCFPADSRVNIFRNVSAVRTGQQVLTPPLSSHPPSCHRTPHPRGKPQKNVARNLCGPRA